MIRLNSRNSARFSNALLIPSLLVSLFGILPSQPSFALLQGNQVILVDDFDSQTGVNRLGGELKGAFVEGEKAFGKSGASLALDYEVDEASPEAYFWIGLGKKDPAQGTSEPADLSEKRYLSFWVKLDEASTGTEVQLFVEFHEDTNQDKKFVLDPDTTDRALALRWTAAASETPWKKIILPLSQFRKIQSWDRILELDFVLEIKRGTARGRVLIDDLLLGSNYPEGLKNPEIPMQNRVSSFKINHQRVTNSEVKLKGKLTSLILNLTFVDPYLEKIRFEESQDGGQTWQPIQSFYDHANGGSYSVNWKPSLRKKSKQQTVLLRAVGVNVLGGETELAGPYPILFI